jgi:hypothetical protein
MLMLLLLAGASGTGVSADLIKNMQEEKKQTLERWKASIKMLVTLILGYVFYLRAPVDAVDSAGKTVYSSEGIQKSMEKMFQENAYAALVKDSIMAAIDTIFELLKPSASESMLFAALLSGPPKQAGNTTVIQQQPQPVPIGTIQQPMTFNALRQSRFAGPQTRAQAVITPEGYVITE